MLRIPRWVAFAALVVVLTLGALSSLSVATVRRSFPQQDGQISITGLRAPVEVLRDAYGVPHVYADNAEDLFLAQGYLQAQDRFYQMDVARHITAGRLSELFGPDQLETDIFVRTSGWRRVAEAEVALQSASTRRALDAYAAGVNAYLANTSPADLSLEYSLLRLQGLAYTPEKWAPADSLAWLKAMAWQLGSNVGQELADAELEPLLGKGKYADLYPSYPIDGFQPTLTRGNVVDGRFDPNADADDHRTAPALTHAEQQAGSEAARTTARALRSLGSTLDQSGAGALGSNAFVVSGERTDSGRPILSNDPHLATSIPGPLYQIGLHCRTVSKDCPYDVAGFSMAPLPGVIIGQNATLAWGLTTSYVDATDGFLEELKGDTVRVGESFEPLQTRVEQFRAAGTDEVREVTVRSTRHGPLLSDVSDSYRRAGEQRTEQGQPAYGVSVSWTGLTPGRSLDALLRLNRAADIAQARKAVSLMSAPSQNLVLADSSGSIGYQLLPSVPERGKGKGRDLSPGWDPAYGWTGTVPFEKLPYAIDPPSGVLVTANQPIIGRQYPHPLGTEYSYGWRSQQILDRLGEDRNVTMDEAQAIFGDETIRFAADIVPALLKIKITDGWVREGQETMVGWDYAATRDSAAAAYFYVTMQNVLKLTFRDELPQEQWPTGGDRWYAVLSGLIKDPNNDWWDDVSTTDVVEKRDDILLAAMTDARSEITALMSRDVSGWQWGKLHTVTLENQTLGNSGIGPVEALFNRGPSPVGGGPAVVNATGFTAGEGYAVTSAPAMRMLVDVGAPDGSRWINQTGTSGHAFHAHYNDQTPLWLDNQLLPFVQSRAAVEGQTKRRLDLLPG